MKRFGGRESPTLLLLHCSSDKWKSVSQQLCLVELQFEMPHTSHLFSEAITLPFPRLSFSLCDLNVIYNVFIFFWLFVYFSRFFSYFTKACFVQIYRHFFSSYKAFLSWSPSAVILFLDLFLKGSYFAHSQLMAPVSLDLPAETLKQAHLCSIVVCIICSCPTDKDEISPLGFKLPKPVTVTYQTHVHPHDSLYQNIQMIAHGSQSIKSDVFPWFLSTFTF